MTSYENKKKMLHYYKCQNCNGSCINATTARLTNKIGANEMFVDLLDSYVLEDKYVELFKLQIATMLTSKSKEKKSEDTLIKKQLTELKNKRDKLEERHAYGDTEHDIYLRFLDKIDAQISEIEPKEDISEKQISNLKNKLNKLIIFSQNISKHWVSGSLRHKKTIQKLVFPAGLILDTKNHQYLTSKVNGLLVLKHSLLDDLVDK
jgi:hypothetical protein